MKNAFIRPFINANSETSSEMNELALPQAGAPEVGGAPWAERGGHPAAKGPHLLESGSSEGGLGDGFLTCWLPSGNKENNLLY